MNYENFATGDLLNNYHIDSFKISCDVEHFININIPTLYLITTTGEIHQEFKSKALEIPFMDSKYYVYISVRYLEGLEYKRLIIYFSSKLIAKDYFTGIKLGHVWKVLNNLEKLEYIKIKSKQHIFENMFVSDVDICQDYIFANNDVLRLRERFKYHKSLYKATTKLNNGIKTYTGKHNQVGMSVNNRNTQSVARPFFKFYNKSHEIFLPKNNEFFFKLPPEHQEILKTWLILRYEFTLRNKAHFEKYNLTNKLYDLFDTHKTTWKKVKHDFFNLNFKQFTYKTIGKIKPKDRAMLNVIKSYMLTFIPTHLESNEFNFEFWSEIRSLIIADYENSEKNRQEKYYDFIRNLYNSELNKPIIINKVEKSIDKIFI